MAQHALGLVGQPLRQRRADRGRAVFGLSRADQRHDGHAKAECPAQILQRLRRTRAVLAETEIRAHGDMRDAQPVGQNLLREGLRGQARQHRAKGKFVQVLNTKAGQAVGPCLGVHEAKGRRVGGEILARMRLECQDAQGRVAGGAGGVDDRAVTLVDAIEIAHGNRCASCLGLQPGPVAMDLQCAPNRAPRTPQSNLRLGASTTASPFKTTVSPTRQRVASVTRRFAWSMA